MIDIHQNKTDLEKKHLNKQMVKSLKGMSMYIYIKNIKWYHMPK